MTDPNANADQTAVPGAESAANGIDAPTEGGDTGEQHSGSEKPMPREQRYRIERNQARQALADAEARIAEMQTRDLERIAGETMSNPADLLTLSGKALADFRDSSGEIDAELVAEAAAEVLASRPGLGLRHPAFDPSQGRGGAAPRSGPTWDSLLSV